MFFENRNWTLHVRREKKGCKEFRHKLWLTSLEVCWPAAAAAAKSLQSCPTLCDPVDCSLPGFSAHGILQARTLELVAISFSNAWKWKVKVKSLSHVRLLVTPWTAAYQASLPMGFSRQEYWSGVPLPSPESAIGIHIPPHSWTSLSPPTSPDCHKAWFELSVSYSEFPVAIHFWASLMGFLGAQ